MTDLTRDVEVAPRQWPALATMPSTDVPRDGYRRAVAEQPAVRWWWPRAGGLAVARPGSRLVRVDAPPDVG